MTGRKGHGVSRVGGGSKESRQETAQWVPGDAKGRWTTAREQVVSRIVGGPIRGK